MSTESTPHELLEAIPPRDQPLATYWSTVPTPPAYVGARARRFVFTSRGDRVPGLLLLPGEPAGGDGRFPLVLLAHGAGGSKHAEYMQAAAPWLAAGVAIASIDFPLHGERHSAKLSERLLASLPALGAGAGAASLALWREFVLQSLCDLRGALDVLQETPEIAKDRVVYASFSLGSILGGLFCALDPRPRAAALALGGGGLGPPMFDPARYVARFAPRPLLMINAERDALIPRSASEALFAAASEPKRIEWFDAPHDALPGVALKAMWTFIEEQLR